MPEPLFIAGNKRSGTSQLVRLLNLHPRVFVAHESDVVWILYQFQRQAEFAPHPWDSGRGMEITLTQARSQLRPDRSVRENFHALQQVIMATGNPWLPPCAKSALAWTGDKKPFQHTDPELLDFIAAELPDAAFVHIVRHPFAVALSSTRFNRTTSGDFWLGMSLEQKVARWTFHEERVNELEQRFPGRVHSLRYEDLCARPEDELSRLFAFLSLDAPAEVLAHARRTTERYPARLPSIRVDEATRRMAARHGYDLALPPASRLALAWDEVAWRLRHRRQR